MPVRITGQNIYWASDRDVTDLQLNLMQFILNITEFYNAPIY